ncbi:MAG: TIGR02117 family protein [Bacteroidota bacterium]
MVFKKIIWRTIKILGIFFFLIALYFISAFALSSIPINSDFKQCEKDAVEIHILTNGFHTDLVLPFKNQYMDWSKLVNPSQTKSGDSTALNVAFGWGDKGFYLQTKTWDDLKFSTAFNALFYLSTSAMHVTFYNKLQETESCTKICISKEHYLKLVNYISESFNSDSLGIPQQITGAAYGYNDSFYETKGKYSLFFTCNTWANNGLKKADLKACFWTPFDSGIFKKYNQ